jgi:signal transduction histidine kinase
VLLGGALVFGLEPVYAVLLTAVLMTVFFVLLSWQSAAEWRKAMRQLRPIVTSEGWYERLTDPAVDPAHGARQDAFQVLCEAVITAPLAFLVPAGPLASFVAPHAYPSSTALPGRSWAPEALATDRLATAVSADEYAGAGWAVPLWSERGLTGVLLLGARADGSLYSEEELEIARATGERLIDTAASLALSQKLMALQREQMAQSQLLDQRTRRVLHDEVLPLIHTAMLAVASGERSETALERLSDAHREVSALLRILPSAMTPDVARLGPIAALRKAVDGEFGLAFESVTWDVSEAAEVAAHGLPALKAETLYYAGRELVRNAARHAQPPGSTSRRLKVSATCQHGQMQLIVEDNGSGWDGGTLKGHGLELHIALMAIAGGALTFARQQPGSTQAALVMPVMAADRPGLDVKSGPKTSDPP